MRHATVSFLLFLAACDPLESFSVTVSVSPATQQSYSDEAKGRVLVEGSVVGVLCAPSAEAQEFSFEESHIGCANTVEIHAWIVPGEATDVCGPVEGVGEFVDGEPVDPQGSATLFPDADPDRCLSGDDQATIEL